MVSNLFFYLFLAFFFLSYLINSWAFCLVCSCSTYSFRNLSNLITHLPQMLAELLIVVIFWVSTLISSFISNFLESSAVLLYFRHKFSLWLLSSRSLFSHIVWYSFISCIVLKLFLAKKFRSSNILTFSFFCLKYAGVNSLYSFLAGSFPNLYK